MRRMGMRNNLIELINQLNWTAINTVKVGPKLEPDQVSVSFKADKKKPELIDRVQIRIGHKVLEELGWNYGDKIFPSFNPDDMLLFLLCKNPNGRGFTLTKDQNTTIGSLAFKWKTLTIPLNEMPPTLVDFEPWDGKLVLRAAPQSQPFSRNV